MEVKYIPIEDLVPYPNNPKSHPERQVKKIAGSIKKFGFRIPLLVRTDMEVIAGHGRILAVEDYLEGELDDLLDELEEGTERYDSLLHANEGEVPCIVSDDMTEAQAKAFRIADNKVAESGWDDELLEVELEELEEEEEILPEGGFALEDLGFEEEEIYQLFDEMKEVEEDEFEEENLDEIETDIERGDVYKLGEHRLMCGDATEEEDVNKLMDRDKADMGFTDPPYNMDINYNNFDDDKNINKYKDFINKWFLLFKKKIKDTILITPGTTNLFLYSNYEPDWTCAWWKPNSMTTSKLKGLNVWEPILLWNTPNERIPRDGYEQTLSIQKMPNGDDMGDLHPCPKPLKLISDLVKDFSKKNDIILDLFGGSGSTLIACEQLDRKCYMMEIDPQYCQVIIDRWEEYTGREAKKI